MTSTPRLSLKPPRSADTHDPHQELNVAKSKIDYSIRQVAKARIDYDKKLALDTNHTDALNLSSTLLCSIAMTASFAVMDLCSICSTNRCRAACVEYITKLWQRQGWFDKLFLTRSTHSFYIFLRCLYASLYTQLDEAHHSSCEGEKGQEPCRQSNTWFHPTVARSAQTWTLPLTHKDDDPKPGIYAN